jgi:hypothetical protein
MIKNSTNVMSLRIKQFSPLVYSFRRYPSTEPHFNKPAILLDKGHIDKGMFFFRRAYKLSVTATLLTPVGAVCNYCSRKTSEQTVRSCTRARGRVCVCVRCRYDFSYEERNLLGLETMHVTEILTFSKGLSVREEHLLYLHFSL